MSHIMVILKVRLRVFCCPFDGFQAYAPATAGDRDSVRRGREKRRTAAVLDPALEGEHPCGDLQSRLRNRRQRF